jgi:hypothetical protein
MNSKNIKKHMKNKINDWLESIDDSAVRKSLSNNIIVTGGAMVSLLTGEKVHDYDIYFRTKQATIDAANYYVSKWNSTHPDSKQASVQVSEDGRVKVFIQSAGVVGEETEKDENGRNMPKIDQSDNPFPPVEEELSDEEKAALEDEKDGKDKPKYRPIFLSSNAITLSDKIQVVIRFYGEVEEIHKNYDFAHCTCSWTSWDNEVQLPTKALECIINKELYYIGSKYPLCSIIRTRKFIERGYHINAGQYVKMAFQLNELDLHNIEVLEEQLTGVDTGYFQIMIDALREQQERTGKNEVDNAYVIELINRMF